MARDRYTRRSGHKGSQVLEIKERVQGCYCAHVAVSGSSLLIFSPCSQLIIFFSFLFPFFLSFSPQFSICLSDA